MKIMVTGLIGSYPLGGVGWDYLAYVSGFGHLGHEVLYLEDTGGSFAELMSRQGALASLNKTQFGTQEKSQRAVP
jgi:hypothetical protein